MICSSFITKPITFIVLSELVNAAVFTNLHGAPAKVLWCTRVLQRPVWQMLPYLIYLTIMVLIIIFMPMMFNFTLLLVRGAPRGLIWRLYQPLFKQTKFLSAPFLPDVSPLCVLILNKIKLLC